MKNDSSSLLELIFKSQKKKERKKGKPCEYDRIVLLLCVKRASRPMCCLYIALGMDM